MRLSVDLLPMPQLFGTGLVAMGGILAVMVARERRGRPIFSHDGPSGFAVGFSESKANPLSHQVSPVQSLAAAVTRLVFNASIV